MPRSGASTVQGEVSRAVWVHPESKIEEGRPVLRGVAGGRAILDRETVHIHGYFRAERSK